MQPHPLDESKDFVQRQDRRQAQERFDNSERSWEHLNDPSLRRGRIPWREKVILMGIAVVLVIGLVFVLSFCSPAGGPQ